MTRAAAVGTAALIACALPACSGDGAGAKAGPVVGSGGAGGAPPVLGDPIDAPASEEWVWVPIEGTQCADGSPATVRIEPQTVAVPAGPGYPFLGDFGVEFSLIGSDRNTYGGPLGTEGSGNSSLYATALDPCPDGPGAFQTELASGRIGMEGSGKVGKVLRGSGVFNTIFQHHSFSWTLTPKK